MAVSRQLGAAAAGAVLAGLLAGCQSPMPGHEVGSMPGAQVPAPRHPDFDADVPIMPRAGSGRGGYYQDDGPGDNPPPNLRDTPDAEVRAEPLARAANRPYVVFGKTYTPMLAEEPFEQRGAASWYGRKFHGQRTSSGEPYDMYKMTGAHPTLPIPSYARVTSLETGKSVVVRINDRGPFHASRIVDVSYTAALKLGLLGKGSHEVRVERLLPNAAERIATVRRSAPEAETGVVTTMAVDVPPPIERVVEAAPVPAPAPVVQGGFYVQLGAFSRAERAMEIRDQLQGGALGVVEVVPAGALHRIFGGPFASRELALEALRAIPAALGLKPIVVKR